jgi:inosine triphosphate pyrophosphatase
MKEPIFVSSNDSKARYLSLWLGRPITHHSYEVPEIQSLNLKEVASHKATQAYLRFQCPVVVEDVALTFHAFGKLPGTLVKWFVSELKPAGMCRLLENYDDRSATAEIMYALHDGKTIHYFHAAMNGSIAKSPQGESDFGWNAIFIPEGQRKTYAELSDEQLKQYSHRALAIDKLRAFLDRQYSP